ncbi:MAG: hypothetical protein M0Z75_00800 [Nitrospiraceae bacterium]|nr:hypothetical protein [Nitrospiraceae bacterium]
MKFPKTRICRSGGRLSARAGFRLAILLTLAAAWLLLAAGGAFAATYYVSPGGSDSAAGTSSAPWGTFSHAMPALRPGDTLYLEDGTYNQSLNISVSGSSGAYVTVKALNDGKAIVSTTYPTSPLVIYNRSYVEVDGINFRNSGAYDSNTYCATDGNGYSNVNGINIYNSNHIILRRDVANGASGCNSAVIGLAAVSDSLLEDCAGSGQGRVVLNMNSCNNITIRRCWLRYTGPSTGGGDTANITQVYDSDNVLMENNIGVNYTGEGIEFFNTWAHYGSDYGNKFYGNIAWSPYAGVAGALFLDSAECGETVSGTVFSDNVGIVGSGGWNAEVVNSAPSDGTIYTNNTFVGGSGLVMAHRGGCSNQASVAQNVSGNSWVSLSPAMSGDTIEAHDYNNYYNVGSVGAGLSSNETQLNPDYPTSTYGLGAYLMAPPALKGKGGSGSDIGANVLYEYVNGTLTSTPLWPWPMESRIAAEFGVSPTYANDGAGHTGGLWKTLSGIPTRTGDSSASATMTPPVPVSPANGSTTGTTVTFQWDNPDGDSGLSYSLLLSKNSQFTDSTSVQVASAQNKNNAYAGVAGVFLFGIVVSGGFLRRKRLLLLLAAALLSAMFLVSCGGGGGSQAGSGSAATGTANNFDSYTVSGLSGNTTYYWKVVATDNTGQQVSSQVSSFVTN